MANKNVTKNPTQSDAKGTLKHNEKEAVNSGSFELKTPSGIAGMGLSGINRPSNKSNDKAVGSGGGASNQSSRAGVDGSAPRHSNNSGNKNFGE